MDMEELFTAREQFTTLEWMDLILRSIGMEPANLEQRVKWHLLARMIPFVEISSFHWNCIKLHK